MHVESRRAGAQHVIVHGSNLQPALDELEHDRIDLRLQQHQIAHGHHAAMRRLERDPAAQRQRRLDGNTIERDRKVGARKAVTVHIAVDGGLPAEDVIDLLPIDFLRSRGGVQEHRKDRSDEQECWAHGDSPSLASCIFGQLHVASFGKPCVTSSAIPLSPRSSTAKRKSFAHAHGIAMTAMVARPLRS
jgi:hypothetical protein